MKKSCSKGQEVTERDKRQVFRQRNSQLRSLFTAVNNYWYGMPIEMFNEMLMEACENGHFPPQDEHKMDIFCKLGLRLTEKEGDIARPQVQFQGKKCHNYAIPGRI